MSVVHGLSAILETNKPWQEQRPTHKQFDWVREYLGEGELDRIIFRNLSRGDVKDIIERHIQLNTVEKVYKHVGVSQGYVPPLRCMHGGDDLFAKTNRAGMFYDYDYQSGEWEEF
jgi:hypothetical protein